LGDHLGQQTLGAYLNPFHAIFLTRVLGPGSFDLDDCDLFSVGVEGFLVSQNAPSDTGQLIGQSRGELVSMKPG
jgi:hypothetical protein